MRYTPLSAATYREHRARFRSGMEKGGLALFHSNDIMPTSADGTMPFKQATDIMYLTGIDQEESVLLLFPDTMDPKDREILFVRETNEHIAIWEGHKFSPLFLPETVAGHFNHPKRQVLVGNCHVVIHKELPETGCKTQKHLPFVGLDGVLSCRESVKIFFQGWVD